MLLHLVRRAVRILWRGPRMVLMAIAATFGPPKPEPPDPPVAVQIEEGDRS